MRRLLCIAAALCLLLTLCGCDLRNRRPSSEFIPETQATEPTEPPETEQTAEPTQTAPPESTQPPQLIVRETSSKRGVYVDRYYESVEYSYRLPFVDFESSYCAQVNTTISAEFGKAIDSQLAAMETGEPISIVTVDYETRLRGGTQTLYVWLENVEGKTYESVFTFDQQTGAQASGAQILECAGLTEAEFLPLAEQTVRAAFDAEYGAHADDLRYTTSLDKTLAEGSIRVDMPMRLNREDRLEIEATLYDLAGAAYTLWLPLIQE